MSLFIGSIRSSVLGVDTPLAVVFPQDKGDYKGNSSKVLYLFHGLGNNAFSWSTNTAIERYATESGYTVIMPDAGKSFYMDVSYGEAYFTYLTQELPELVGNMFGLSRKKEDTAVAGLSMGGYGALKCGLTYPEKYFAVGSFSGVLDLDFVINSATEAYDIRRLQGVFGENLEVLPENDLRQLGINIRTKDKIKILPDIYITCGTEDYLYQVNKEYVSFLTREKLPFTYEEWQGEHKWDFWDLSIQNFFTNFLSKGN